MTYSEICTEKKDHQVFKESPQDEKESSEQINRNIIVAETEESFLKSLSLVTTEKCERLFHPLKKKRVLWKKNKHRIKGKSFTNMNVNI